MGINPFCQKFECGARSERYWTYDRMVLKIEDCTDILKDIHPGIDFIFLFDHPCRNYRGIECRFYVTKMNSEYVGAQLGMHPTNTKKEVGYLGLYKKFLKVGDEKQMVFREIINVPLWITPKERVYTKLSQYDEQYLKDKKKA